jgi:hypothetical protein
MLRPVGQSLDAQMTGTDEYALLIDLHSQEAGPIGESSLAELKLLERQNLQSWVEAYPEMVGGDLMLITTEFDQWELRERHVPDRLDVLMLDKDGDLLVAELKRGEAAARHSDGGTMSGSSRPA